MLSKPVPVGRCLRDFLLFVCHLLHIPIGGAPLGGGSGPHRTFFRRCSRGPHRWLLCLLLLVLTVSAIASPQQGNFSEPAVKQAALEQLSILQQLPYNPDSIAKQFSHDINSWLPDGAKSSIDSDEYWQDPETQLMHHKLPAAVVSDAQFQKLVDVTRKHALSDKSCVAYSLDDITGYSGLEKPMSIELGDVKRIFAPPRRNYTPLELDIIEAKVTELLKSGVVVPVTSSNFACNVVLAAKRAPDGSWSDKRFCVNFIPINKHTVLDNYGSHKAAQLLQAVSQKKFLTALDLRSGFHQIMMEQADISKTAFWYMRKNQPPQLMAYTRMPFGLKNASAKFQQVMDAELVRHGCNDFAYAYIDDLIIASDTWEEHCEHVDRVLNMLSECNLKIHPSKSLFGSNVLEYLGHNVVAGHGITMNEAKVMAIKSLPDPRTLLELRSILGFMSYYRHFIPGFSSIAQPLFKLLKKGVVYQWGAEQVAAYQALKDLMTKPGRVLRPVDPTRPLVLHTDWSVRGIGAVLGQTDEEGREYMCAAISRSLNKHERNYPAYKGELLALTWAIKSFRGEVHGVNFKLVTDHHALQWLMRARDLTGQYSRWQMMLQEHDFQVVHRPGVTHQNADVLSRFPQATVRDFTGVRLDSETSTTPDATCSAAVPDSSRVETVSSERGVARAAVDLCPDGHCQAVALKHSLSVALDTRHGAKRPRVCSNHIDEFAPKFHDILGPNAAHIDPEHYSQHVICPETGEELQPQDELPAGQLRGAPKATTATPAAAATLLAAVATSNEGLQEAVARAVAAAGDKGTTQAGELDTSVVASSFYPCAQTEGITLVELCGGMCSGLEAWLKMGIRVNKYLYCDVDATAREVAQFRINNLVARYPHLLSPHAVADAFSIPQDLRVLQQLHITDHIGLQPQQIVVMAGWPCQEYSPAGLGKVGQRAGLLQHVIRIITALQAAYPSQPPAYLLENIPLQHNFNHPHIRTYWAKQVEGQLGKPVEMDAAKAGSYAVRLRNYWTNLAAQPVHQSVCAAVHVPREGNLYDILLPGRHPMPVLHDDAHNTVGSVRRVWPTLMSYTLSRNFCAGKPGCVYDQSKECFTEPCAEEREVAMGYEPSTTAAPGLSDADRCGVLGQAIDLNALQVVLLAASQLHSVRLASFQQPQPCCAMPHITSMSPTGTAMLTEAAPATTAAQLPPYQDGIACDVWLDAPVLHYLQSGVKPSDPAAARIVRRAKAYSWFNNRLFRSVTDRYTGQVAYRQVPEPKLRDALIADLHVALGHLGEKRMMSAVSQAYWWYGMTVDVKRVLAGCKLCARAHASAGHEQRDMLTESADTYGLFHRWGLDYAQDLPASAQGNRHCLIAIDYYSKWIEAVPMHELGAAATVRQFQLNVIARYGPPAEVVSDGGPSFSTHFHDMCLQKHIHHRVITEDSPRSNGLAERAVQTVKWALRKHVADRQNALTWDTEGLVNILLGYRCTPQAATGHSPARIVYALDPVLDAEQYLARRGPIDYSDPDTERVGAELQERALLAQQIGCSVVHNLRTAHERDTRRFQARRAGLYVPKVQHFMPGDFVFIMTQGQQKLGGTLGLRARNEVLQVLKVKDSGVLLLQNQLGQKFEKHFEHCVPCLLPNILGDTYAGLTTPPADLPCQVCGDARYEESMLLCDSCDTGWHTYCLTPPLADVPDGAWLCPSCVAAGMTHEQLQQKHDDRVLDKHSRPNLELPARTRIAKARALAAQWHGQGVCHVHRGVIRTGRVVFQGILNSKWFRVHWEDGSSSEHNAQLLRHLVPIPDSDLPPTVPPRPEPAVIMASQPSPGAVNIPTTSFHFRRFMQALMPGPCWDAAVVVSAAWTAWQRGLQICAQPAAAAVDWEAVLRVCVWRNVRSLVAPLAADLSCIQNWLQHPIACYSQGSQCSAIALHPCDRRIFCIPETGGGPDAVYLNADAALLDGLLPMALHHAQKLVLARVPASYVLQPHFARLQWLLHNVWCDGCGLLLHVVNAGGEPQPLCWLLVFASREQRTAMLAGRLPERCVEAEWDARQPHHLCKKTEIRSADTHVCCAD